MNKSSNPVKDKTEKLVRLQHISPHKDPIRYCYMYKRLASKKQNIKVEHNKLRESKSVT